MSHGWMDKWQQNDLSNYEDALMQKQKARAHVHAHAHALTQSRAHPLALCIVTVPRRRQETIKNPNICTGVLYTCAIPQWPGDLLGAIFAPRFTASLKIIVVNCGSQF
eukprot:5265051-Amphidinium_carterae.2